MLKKPDACFSKALEVALKIIRFKKQEDTTACLGSNSLDLCIVRSLREQQSGLCRLERSNKDPAPVRAHHRVLDHLETQRAHIEIQTFVI